MSNEIEKLRSANKEKGEMLDKLEVEMRGMKDKVEYFYESFQLKDQEYIDL
jgi:archaellum component FlaD/FlaE